MSFLGDPMFVVTSLGVLLTALGVLIAFFQLRHKSANSSTKVNAKGIKPGRDSMIAGRDINVFQNLNAPGEHVRANKNSDAAANALKMYKLCGTFRTRFKEITYPGQVVIKSQPDQRVALLNRRDAAANTLTELHAIWKDLIPFLDSQKIELCLNSLDGYWASYNSLIGDYVGHLTLIQQLQQSNALLPNPVLQKLAKLTDQLFVTSYQSTFAQIDTTLTELENILAEYHRKNIE